MIEADFAQLLNDTFACHENYITDQPTDCSSDSPLTPLTTTLENSPVIQPLNLPELESELLELSDNGDMPVLHLAAEKCDFSISPLPPPHDYITDYRNIETVTYCHFLSCSAAS